MNIYFSASIKGGRTYQPHYTQIIQVLSQYGTILSDHVADETLSSYGETELTKEEIYHREVERLGQADIVVSDVTVTSLGVGFTLAKALDLQKKVICLYHGKNIDTLSAMISGAPKISLYTYTTIDEIEQILHKAFFDIKKA